MRIWQQKLINNALPLLAVSFTLLPLPAQAESETMRQGFAEYNSGNYSEAVGHLQGALATDFNNAKLHYFLANAYMHLNQKDAGIREYRIAYALDPQHEVGKLCKQALGYLGVDNDKPKEKDASDNVPKSSSDPILDKIEASLRQQAEQAKGLNQDSTDVMNKELAKRSNDNLERAKSDMQKDMSYYRRGRLIQLPLPDDALKQLDTLKHFYDSQKNAYADGAAKHSEEIQKSADNLSGLLNDKGKPGTPKLVPEGTNLYIRTYKNDQQGIEKSTSATLIKPATTAAATAHATGIHQAPRLSAGQPVMTPPAAPPTGATPTTTPASAPPAVTPPTSTPPVATPPSNTPSEIPPAGTPSTEPIQTAK